MTDEKNSPADKIVGSTDVLERLARFVERGHAHCDDCWYSCPKAADGCCDDSQEKNVCNCGADEHNAKASALMAELIALLRSNAVLSGAATKNK